MVRNGAAGHDEGNGVLPRGVISADLEEDHVIADEDIEVNVDLANAPHGVV